MPVLKLFIVLVSALFANSVSAQGTTGFKNLDFEVANLSAYAPGSAVPIGVALPGWSGQIGTSQASQVLYDSYNIGGGAISIMDPLTTLGYAPLDGNYSALLMGAGSGFGGPTTISQTGFVPNGTRSLVVDILWQIAPPVVMLNNQTVTLISLANFPTYTVYAADITSFAGKTATLSFTAPVPSSSFNPSFLELDDIVFSTASVPEPNQLALFMVGGVFCCLRFYPGKEVNRARW
jgi:hypothetical protein